MLITEYRDLYFFSILCSTRILVIRARILLLCEQNLSISLLWLSEPVKIFYSVPFFLNIVQFLVHFLWSYVCGRSESQHGNECSVLLVVSSSILTLTLFFTLLLLPFQVFKFEANLGCLSENCFLSVLLKLLLS